jgi:hypothetical protein
VVEGALFATGILLYLRTTQAKNKKGHYGLWALIGFLVLVYMGNLFGPPPTRVTDIAWVSQAQWVLVLWAYWLDSNREVKLVVAGPVA